MDHQVNPSIHILVETLRDLGIHWAVASRYATLLQRVLDEYHESERVPPQGVNGERVTPSTVRILADMRRTAYDLDFLISRQPRQFPATVKGASITPARTPAPNELEYLDVFDFFNMPRLPVPETGAVGQGPSAGNGHSNGNDEGEAGGMDLGANNEFNITNFMYDADSDWFMRPS